MFQTIAIPGTVAIDPGIDHLVVLVDTSAGTWTDGGTLLLPPGPGTGARVTVKDRAGNAPSKNIVVNGNGALIDGGSMLGLALAFTALTFAFDGTQWRVV